MRLLLIVFFSALFSSAQAATDSLIIKGRILNLNGRLYRQARFINFSRNNILQPQSELSKQAPLNADGSFRVSLPMLFQEEEIYLDYGGKAFTTFLGSPGEVEITFNGDSLGKAKKLFYFAGVNADANNLYAQYLAADERRLNANKLLGPDFFKSFWQKSPGEAVKFAQQRTKYRLGAIADASQNTVTSPTLDKWARAVVEEEQLQILYEHALSNLYQTGKDLKDSLDRLDKAPLTAQRVLWANRFGNYADLLIEQKRLDNPSRGSSLPVRLMASLIKANTPNISPQDSRHLDQVISNGLAEKGELDFLSKLFAKNETVMNLLFDFERESRLYADLFDSTGTEFLKARYLPRNFYKFSYKQQQILHKHIQSRIGIPQFRQSLDELMKLELKDSADIRKFVTFSEIRTKPAEVVPGYWITGSRDRGTSWLNQIIDENKGKTIYLAKWSLSDPKSREQLEYIPLLQSRVPEDVVFVYLHLPDEVNISNDLARQFIVRHKLKGIHLFLDDNQAMDLLFRLNPLDPGTFAIIRPNGKFAAKTASPPADIERTAKAILEANR